MKGKYPKDFKWTGWYPNDLCYVIPIIKTEEQFWLPESERGKDNAEITDVPQGFKTWVANNQDKIARAEKRGTLPYFVRDNRKRVKGAQLLEKEAYSSMRSADSNIKLTPTAIQDISHIQSKIDEIANAHPEYFARGYRGINAISKENGYMSTTMDGLISINFATDKNGFNAGECLVNAFKKLGGKESLTFNEEYAIEALWHEILHNKSNNTMVLPRIDSPNGFSRCVAETINQLVARNTYGDFLSNWGRKPLFHKQILEQGYSYNYPLQNLRKLLSKVNINEQEFLKKASKEIMKDYTNIDVKISNILSTMYHGKDKWKISRVFNEIEMAWFNDSLEQIS